MSCFNPIVLHRFDPNVLVTYSNDPDRERRFPCGKCLYCRAQRRMEWATRVYLESSMWDRACFVTLTYRDEDLPEDKSLHKDELQRFFKRLRWYISRKSDRKIKYFACGEYGSQLNTGRPHFHAIIFGLDFPDNTYSIRPDEDASFILDAWDKGFIFVEPVNFERCKYLMKYLFKQETKEDYLGREPPFRLSSQGLGKSWLYENIDKVLSNPRIRLFQTLTVGIPRYFLKKIKDRSPVMYAIWRKWVLDPVQKIKELEKMQKIIDKAKSVHYKLYDYIILIERYFKNGFIPESRSTDYNLRICDLYVRIKTDIEIQERREWEARERLWQEKAIQNERRKYETLYSKRQSQRRVRSPLPCPY